MKASEASREAKSAQRNAALVLAGLPGAVSSVLNDRVLTFLNRAHKITLDPLAIGDVEAHFAHAFEESGMHIGNDMRHRAALATEGSPYLLQLVGHYMVKFADNDGRLSEDNFESALRVARDSFEKGVCETTLASLSDKDVDFLRAMLIDVRESNISDIARRMGVTSDYAQKYRKRLISGGIIASPRRGHVVFAVPYLEDYLRKALL